MGREWRHALSVAIVTTALPPQKTNDLKSYPTNLNDSKTVSGPRSQVFLIAKVAYVNVYNL